MILKSPSLLYCVFALLMSAKVFSQTSNSQINYDKSISFPSPNAASIGKFGFIPVNYSTGVANISIPLWEIKEEGLSLPITLTYNNNGLRVAEEASWVGHGWSLLSGGAITRIVRGIPDLEGSVLMNNDGGLHYDQLGDPTYIDNLTANRIAKGLHDGEPDLFTFNFGNHSGKFILYQNNAVPIPHTDLQILKTGDNFKITTADGVVYEFAKREITILNDAQGTGFSTLPYTSSWLLTSITSANEQETIEFVYAPNTENIESASNRAAWWTFTGSSSYYDPATECPGGGDRTWGYTKSTVNSWRLEKIKSRTSEISFVPQDNDRADLYGSSKALDAIMIYVKNNPALVKKFKFNYSYFGDGSDTNLARLKLNSVMEFSKNGMPLQPHVFEYYDFGFPSKVGYNMDHWGYSNGGGTGGNLDLIPHVYEWQQYGNAIREPFENAAKSGMLKKIIYPTKGYTLFNYSPNEYMSDAGLKPGPGLRVSQTEDYDGRQSRYVKYTYENPVFYGVPVYGKTYTSNCCECLHPGPSGCLREKRNKLYATVSGQNTSLFAGLSGFSLAYRNVTESAGLNNELGKTEYVYEPSEQYTLDHEMRLKETIVKDNGGFTVRKTTNSYSTLQDKVYYAFRPELVTSHVPCSDFPEWFERDPVDGSVLQEYNSDGDVGSYFVISQWNYLTKTIETDFIQGVASVIRETNYQYGSTPVHRFVTRIDLKQSNGESDVQVLKYPQDYNTTAAEGSDVFYNGLKKLKELHMNNVPIEVQTIKRKSNGQEAVYDGKLMLYKSFINSKNVQLAEVHSLETQTGESVSTSYTSGSALVFNHLPYSKKLWYNYNSSGRMLSRQTSNEQISYLWGYNDALPVAKATGVSYETLLAAYQASGQNLETLRNQPALSKALINTYTYNLLIGPATVSDANNQKTYYSYDDFGRLRTVKDNNNNIIKNYEYNYKVSN